MPIKLVVAHCPHVGVVWKLREGVPAQMSFPSFEDGSKLRGPSPIVLFSCKKPRFGSIKTESGGGCFAGDWFVDLNPLRVSSVHSANNHRVAL
ncbi:hypothetical protein TNCV_4404191 [Trichonephila clavipes]|uniref:Uncharacterized protein n=1 Tax=Trichonephila clavipes TaxID=2585209 RepID=A0A8X6V5N3_TRICX|nr:hypothetical protein TNCV_4404191 [Trichonephila clavipes]